jgi:hypothetical protein
MGSVPGEVPEFAGDNEKELFSENEKATRQRRRPFLQGRIVPTEVKSRQNFLAKSYGAKMGGVKQFLRNK